MMVWSMLPTPSSAISFALKRTTSFTSTPSTTPPAYDEAGGEQSQEALHDAVTQRLAVERIKAASPETRICTSQALLCLQSSTELHASAVTEQQLGFSRELYMQALEALARGLPNGLSSTEQARLLAVFQTLQQQHPELALQVMQQQTCKSTNKGVQGQTMEPSTAVQEVLVVLCRTGATAIKYTVPKIKVGLEQAVAYERKYHVLEKGGVVLSASAFRFADTIARCQLGHVLSGLATALSMGALEAYKVLSETEEGTQEPPQA
ncbi:hypothetical protein BCR37DRAFT_391237 [Protomyces lactucae-debilis]|uniref:Uncharacterized protein n=1 Tax=Protomyces lactucae-debilis TaxID=2754530 RepID=A0A1Y2FRW8_PROLT|nr:uncharacterized protein BCR37DRAFT_391237 [Protomyces lactucae-debilis]ORY85455.1 hypothetical protein BCR37DRAFT_391237 [Protomyces lactucae-debilis]